MSGARMWIAGLGDLLAGADPAHVLPQRLLGAEFL
jgi:hypothetical protein